MDILIQLVGNLVGSGIEAAIQAGQSLGLDVAKLRSALAVELRSQADTIEAKVAEMEAAIDASEADALKG